MANTGSLKRSLDSEDGLRSGCRNASSSPTYSGLLGSNLFLNAFSHYFGYAENNANCLTWSILNLRSSATDPCIYKDAERNFYLEFQSFRIGDVHCFGQGQRLLELLWDVITRALKQGNDSRYFFALPSCFIINWFELLLRWFLRKKFPMNFF